MSGAIAERTSGSFEGTAAAPSEAFEALYRRAFPRVYGYVATLLRDRDGFRLAIDTMAAPFRDELIDVVVGIESRGFILGSAVADRLGAGFVPVRKLGKLPAQPIQARYALEYGTDSLEMHRDAIDPGQRVLIVDDLLATGGTASATVQLVKELGGDIAGIREWSKAEIARIREPEPRQVRRVGLPGAERALVVLVLPHLEVEQPDLVIAGPAFAAGRYGVACGAVCSAVKERLHLPAVTSMHPENPGVDLFRRDAVRPAGQARHGLDRSAQEGRQPIEQIGLPFLGTARLARVEMAVHSFPLLVFFVVIAAA